jgi:acyl carrier protein
VTDSIRELILRCLDELNEGRAHPIEIPQHADVPLYGGEGALDSIDLVSLVIAVEESLEEGFGVSVTLADERALSQERSPFRSVDSFTAYIEGLLPKVA